MKKHSVRRRPPVARIFAVFGSIALLVGVMFMVVAATTNLKMNAFIASGIKTTAKITGKYHSGRPVESRVNYSFSDVTGKTYAGDDAFPFSSWDALRPGDPIDIMYMPFDPSRSAVTQRIQFVAERDPVATYELAAIPFLISGLFFVVHIFTKHAVKYPDGEDMS